MEGDGKMLSFTEIKEGGKPHLKEVKK